MVSRLNKFVTIEAETCIKNTSRRTQIRIEADNGDPDCEQLMLDLHRMAALFIVERMRSEIVATVAAHYQHLTLMAARRAAAKARVKRRKKEGKDGQDNQVRPAVWASSSRCHRSASKLASLHRWAHYLMHGLNGPQYARRVLLRTDSCVSSWLLLQLEASRIQDSWTYPPKLLNAADRSARAAYSRAAGGRGRWSFWSASSRRRRGTRR